MSKKFGLMSVLLGSMLLVACGETVSSSTPTSTPTSTTTSTVSSATPSSSSSSSVASSEIDEAQEFLDIAYDSLGGLIADPSNITAGFQVPSNLANGVTATWASANPGVLSFGQPAQNTGLINAVVNRPSNGDGDARFNISSTLSIPATLTSGNLTRTWTLEVTVKENEVPDLVIENVEDILAIRDVAYDGTLNVTLNDLTIIAKSAGDAFAYDGTGTIMIYGGAAASLVVGSVYTIAGIAEWYFGLWEITNSTATLQPDSQAQFPNKETIDSVDTKVSALVADGKHLSAFGNAASGNFEPIYASLTGKVYMIPNDTGNYNTWILDDENTVGYLPGSATAETKTPANAFMLYYQTPDFNLIRQYNGIVITIDVIIYTYRSNNHAFAIYYIGGPNGVSAILSDEQKQSIDANALSVPATILEATTLTLPTQGQNGSTIAWTSSNSAVIDPTTGVVTIPESAQAITLTASVTVGELAAVVKTFVVVVGLLENTNLAAFDALAVNAIAYSEVKVLWKNPSGSSAGKTFVVGDATGFAYIFNSTVLNINVGDFVGLNYKVGVYRGLNQMTEVQVLTPKAETAPSIPNPTVWDATQATTWATSAKIYAMYVTFENVIGFQSGNFTNGYLPGFGVREIQLNGSSNDLRNQKFNATGFLIGRSSDAPANRITLQVESVTTATAPTDAEILALATQRYVAPVANAELTANLTLPTTYTPVGTTFVANLAWTSSNPDVISNTGVVTRPASGQPDANVTLSYVMSVGNEANAAVEIAYTVKAAEAVAIQTLFTNDFGTVAKTGYSVGNIIYTPTGGTEITAAKDRVQINTSATAPHTSMGAFAVFAPISTYPISYLDINFSSLSGAGKLELDYSVWNSTALGNLTNTAVVSTALLKLQTYNGTEWVDLGDAFNVIANASATEYKKTSFTLNGAAQYRLVYTITGPALGTSNTAYALTVDNLVVTDR
ncbi:MAG: immunoglobulin-like domain-containing protein [Bacilli bacterium]